MTNDIEALKARLRERAAAREFGADPFSKETFVEWQAADTISRLTADNEALRKEVERLEGLLEWTVPIHKDCSHVFIDGIGDVELDYGGKMRAEIRRLTEGRHAFACVVVNLSRQRDAATAHADTLAQEVERLRGEIETYRTAFDGIEPASRLLPLQETEK